MKKGNEPSCLIDFWMQETVKELTALPEVGETTKILLFWCWTFFVVSTWGLIKENIVVFLNLGFRVPVFQSLIHFLWEIFKGV